MFLLTHIFKACKLSSKYDWLANYVPTKPKPKEAAKPQFDWNAMTIPDEEEAVPDVPSRPSLSSQNTGYLEINREQTKQAWPEEKDIPPPVDPWEPETYEDDNYPPLPANFPVTNLNASVASVQSGSRWWAAKTPSRAVRSVSPQRALSPLHVFEDSNDWEPEELVTKEVLLNPDTQLRKYAQLAIDEDAEDNFFPLDQPGIYDENEELSAQPVANFTLAKVAPTLSNGARNPFAITTVASRRASVSALKSSPAPVPSVEQQKAQVESDVEAIRRRKEKRLSKTALSPIVSSRNSPTLPAVAVAAVVAAVPQYQPIAPAPAPVQPALPIVPHRPVAAVPEPEPEPAVVLRRPSKKLFTLDVPPPVVVAPLTVVRKASAAVVAPQPALASPTTMTEKCTFLGNCTCRDCRPESHT